MAQTFFFYDVETSGISPIFGRIMQFAGQRTNMQLQPIGEPVNILVTLPDDVLPDPEAVLVHGITPQRTVDEGLTEREYARFLQSEVFTKDTVAVGFNNIRFDDEFIRFSFWRNFYDPYEWHWKNGRSRWDLLDATRLMRALRPEGMTWPFDAEGKATNRLIALAEANNIRLQRAHDALSDMMATLELARQIRNSQPKLFNYLLKLRDKQFVSEQINRFEPQPFVYASGRYPSEHLKTTVAVVIGNHPNDADNGVLVYDLRYDPAEFTELDVGELAKRLFVSFEERSATTPLPVKKLSINRSPAVAPLSTLNEPSQTRIQLDNATIMRHWHRLRSNPSFIDRVSEAFKNVERLPKRTDPESQLYESFINDKDKPNLAAIAHATDSDLAHLHPNFIDERLATLLLRYKARNIPSALSKSEQSLWEGWRCEKLLKGVDGSLTLDAYGRRIASIAQRPNLSANDTFLLEELKLWGESIAPSSLFSD